MTSTSHALIGTVIAAKVGNPALAAPLALFSHFAADMIPHWDTGTHARKKGKSKTLTDSFIDVVISIFAVFLATQILFPNTNLLYAYSIVFIAQLPDWLMAPYYFFGMKLMKPFYILQKKFDNKLDKPWGIVTQIVIVLLVLLAAKML